MTPSQPDRTVEIEVPADVAWQVRAIAMLRQMDEEDLMREIWDEYVKHHPGIRSPR